MIIEKYDWKFNVDIQKTQSMYGNRVKSEIDAQSQVPELIEHNNVYSILM